MHVVNGVKVPYNFDTRIAQLEAMRGGGPKNPQVTSKGGLPDTKKGTSVSNTVPAKDENEEG